MASIKRIFISSPSDVVAEREAAERVIRDVEAARDDISFEVVRWENDVYSAHTGFQEQIETRYDFSAFDLVLCIFYSRLGALLPEPFWANADGRPRPRTGSEFEFESAIDAARKRFAHTNKAVPDVWVFRRYPELPPLHGDEAVEAGQTYARLKAFFDRWERTPEGHFAAAFNKEHRSVAEFAARFKRDLNRWLDAQTAAIWPADRNPFRKLEAYDETFAPVFFGRSRAVREGVAKLRAAARLGTGFLLVIGNSGVGKSSMVRAGLVPQLRATGGVRGDEEVRVFTFKPGSLGDDPFLELAALLLGRGEEQGVPEAGDGVYADPHEFAALFYGEPRAATNHLRNALNSWGKTIQNQRGDHTLPATALIVVVDQMEEAFALPDTAREPFFVLLAALAAAPEITVIATMRSDFYPALQNTPALKALREAGAQVDLSGPTEREIAEIVEGPAAAAGLTYERDADGTRSLRDDIIDAARPDSLPLLSFTLSRLWQTRGPDGVLRLTDYDAMGRLEGAIAREAEDRFAALVAELGVPEEMLEQALRRVLRRLVEVRGLGEGEVGARAALLGEFSAGSAEQKIIEAFSAERARLFTLEGDLS